MEENRRNLETCINEFFSPQTSNERKRHIEVMLETFSKQSDSWKQVLYFISNSSSNQYVVMYCLNVIENTIKSRWLLMRQPEQEELKSTIYAFLLQHSSVTAPVKYPHFVRNKIIKVLTDIGKFSWPSSYPDFISNIIEMCSNDNTVAIGLMFLKTISEEWPNAKDEISTDRKTELKILMVHEMPRIFELFHRILYTGMRQRLTIAGQSPPPSPSQDSSQSFDDADEALSPIDGILALTLETIAHFGSWIPLDGCISLASTEAKLVPFSVPFVDLLCQYTHVEIHQPNRNKAKHLAVLALGALNELLYRKYIPKEFDSHMNFISIFGIELLNKILNGPTIVSLNHQYLEKVIEYLCLVASAHFFRYDESQSKGFMALLLPFTFKQELPVYYYECLEIWARLLDHLNAQVPFINITANREDLLEKFKQPMLGLAAGIIQSTSKFNLSVEECFEAEDEEDAESPSLSRNIDILVKIGELLPSESLVIVTSTWSDSCRFYVGLQSHLDSTKTTLNIENPVEIEHFNFIVQLIGRVANIFYGDVFKQELSLGTTLMQQLLGVTIYSKGYYFVKSPRVIIQANCEIIYSLRTWSYWLARYHTEIVMVDSTLMDQQNFFEMLSLATEVVFFVLENRNAIDPSIVLAIATFFSTLVNSIRTQYVFQMASVQTLIEKIHTLRESLEPETYRFLNKAVAGLLLLPWQSISVQEWDVRTQLYNTYMQTLVTGLYQSPSHPQTLMSIIHILNDQLDLLMTECAVSKRICWGVLKEVVPFLQRLTSTYLRQPLVSEEILNFFLKIMEVLRQQAGAPFFEESIRGFLNLFSSENLINDLLKETESSSVVVEKFLQMLQFMVKDPSPSFKKFLSDALSVCYDHIYPLLAQRSSPDLKIPFFNFVRDAVNYRWNYFFPGLHIMSGSYATSGASPDPAQLLEAQISKRLDQILQSLGHSFLQPDLEVFRYNLRTLSSWNEKHQFYTKLVTRPQILYQFQTVLLQVLVQKTHDLLREDISAVLHDMAIVNYSKFCNDFIPTFVTSNFSALSKTQQESLVDKFGTNGFVDSQGASNANSIDLPSFSQYLSRFIDDLRFYHFCRTSLDTADSSDQS